MKRFFHSLLSWCLSVIFIFNFSLVMLAFHLFQMIALPFGYTAHKIVLDRLNWSVLMLLRLAGVRFDVSLSNLPPPGSSLIVVANHQSLFDIALLCWYLRPYHPKFISKRELSRGIPTVSFALRNMGGAALIDRNDPRQAVEAIGALGRTIAENHFSACIFPEGTRARDGQMRKFKTKGLLTLCEQAPNAWIVPLAITGSWEIVRYKCLPIPFGVRVTVRSLTPFQVEHLDASRVTEIQEQIRVVVGCPPPRAEFKPSVTLQRAEKECRTLPAPLDSNR